MTMDVLQEQTIAQRNALQKRAIATMVNVSVPAAVAPSHMWIPMGAHQEPTNAQEYVDPSRIPSHAAMAIVKQLAFAVVVSRSRTIISSSTIMSTTMSTLTTMAMLL